MIIKLDATDSTNDFLKRLSALESLSNFTVVTAESQTSGKGQMGTKWVSEKNKNLIMSVLLKNITFEPHRIFDINIAVAVAIIEVLKKYQIANLSLKWPNDIMAGAQKLGGVLIENTIKPNRKLVSIVGIGLNINQIDFENLPQAISMKAILGNDTDRDFLMEAILLEIKKNIDTILVKNQAVLWKLYHQYMFQINQSVLFETPQGECFTAVIKGVSNVGKLQVLKSNGLFYEFGNKEVIMIY